MPVCSVCWLTLAAMFTYASYTLFPASMRITLPPARHASGTACPTHSTPASAMRHPSCRRIRLGHLLPILDVGECLEAGEAEDDPVGLQQQMHAISLVFAQGASHPAWRWSTRGLCPVPASTCDQGRTSLGLSHTADLPYPFKHPRCGDGILIGLRNLMEVGIVTTAPPATICAT
jgi:hypothetical protein